eukprot:TRINITY_DN2404_c0_g1_i10.p1 TRINITY_DN2404_c0_g1~~TRINITY_DN2404_c0_g1_i10.p1  ORF type:complete len:449 (-),score=144.75 TRINITY_DN2404_c0_g1_i10:200-1546(-)
MEQKSRKDTIKGHNTIRKRMNKLLFTIFLLGLSLCTLAEEIDQDDDEFFPPVTESREVDRILKPKKYGHSDHTYDMVVIGGESDQLDPIVLFSHFSTQLPDGIVDHPHRGFETLTYILKGALEYEDFKGNKGRTEAGNAQYLFAGKGYKHAEMPTSKDEPTEAIQIWINVKEKEKMGKFELINAEGEDLPTMALGGEIQIKVIAGETWGMKSKIKGKNPMEVLEVTMFNQTGFFQDVPKGWNVAVYVLKGKMEVGEKQKLVNEGEGAVLKNESGRFMALSMPGGCTFIYIAIKPTGEKVFQRGPFVAKDQEDLKALFDDMQYGRNGFEGSQMWRSKIAMTEEEKKMAGKKDDDTVKKDDGTSDDSKEEMGEVDAMGEEMGEVDAMGEEMEEINLDAMGEEMEEVEEEEMTGEKGESAFSTEEATMMEEETGEFDLGIATEEKAMREEL